jgi:hypothetical protein
VVGDRRALCKEPVALRSCGTDPLPCPLVGYRVTTLSRLPRNPAATLATDNKLASFEAHYRREVLDECVKLIAQFST